MTNSITFQSPDAPDRTLLSALLLGAHSADSGGGIFAWSNVHGSRALFESPQFRAFLNRGTFQLIVGTDSITDSATVELLRSYQEEIEGLSIRALVHNRQALFHPKFAWFCSGADLRLIVGSGNLTRGGLQANWEIFGESTLQSELAEEQMRAINSWVSAHQNLLLELDDDAVAEAVSRNDGDERNLRNATRSSSPSASIVAGGERCLVAQIPKSRKDKHGNSMFSQANFNRETFVDFFEVEGNQNEILLFHVESNGSLGALESRQGLTKPSSSNYYFELGSAAGIPHSGANPPIAVFLALDSGAYLYLHRLPGETGYAELDGLLTERFIPSGNQGKRVVVTRETLGHYWPTCPVLKAPEPAI